MKHLNIWNKIRYSFYAPFYNIIVSVLKSARKKALSAIDVCENDNVLILGCGTGLDLKYLPKGPKYVLADITPIMLTKAEKLAKELNHNFETVLCSGDNLPFTDRTFDKTILTLIIAIIPDPETCLKEVRRTLKDDGEIYVFDKFAPPGKKINVILKFINLFTNLFFSDITRSIEELCKSTNLKIVEDHPILLGNTFRRLTIKK